MEYPIAVNYEYTNNLYKAKQWLNNLPDLFAADFEVASKFTKKQKEVLKLRLENCYNNEKQRILFSGSEHHPGNDGNQLYSAAN